MYICICNAITERQVAASVAEGASSLQDLQTDLGVATCCGRCADTAREYLPGGRYAALPSDAPAMTTVGLVETATTTATGEAANDSDPLFQEIIVQRA